MALDDPRVRRGLDVVRSRDHRRDQRRQRDSRDSGRDYTVSPVRRCQEKGRLPVRRRSRSRDAVGPSPSKDRAGYAPAR
jgi:hypothetical protein